MALICPACQNRIRHSEAEASLWPGVIYRCPVCRLELIVDAEHDRMALAPFARDEDDARRRSTDTGTPVGHGEAMDRTRHRQTGESGITARQRSRRG
jgi:uncharacterized protein YbaR (Trm112 family)